MINNAKEATEVELPKEATAYVLAGEKGFRSRVMTLNGKPLALGENDALPCLCGEKVAAGKVELSAGSFEAMVMGEAFKDVPLAR